MVVEEENFVINFVCKFMYLLFFTYCTRPHPPYVCKVGEGEGKVADFWHSAQIREIHVFANK